LTSDNHDRLVARRTSVVEAATEIAMRRTSWARAGHCALLIPQAVVPIPALAILAIATALMATPARAQTYDPNYPVCLQTYGIDGGYIECGYTSLAQCAQSASGRAAECIVNPYFRTRRCPRAHAISGVVASIDALRAARQPVGWVEPLRNPSPFRPTDAMGIAALHASYGSISPSVAPLLRAHCSAASTVYFAA
jgi:Protein of unknown function (DUF3551)